MCTQYFLYDVKFRHSYTISRIRSLNGDWVLFVSLDSIKKSSNKNIFFISYLHKVWNATHRIHIISKNKHRNIRDGALSITFV